jgi:uncharacterized protein YutE (UPF0331/DUF86 family)
VVLRAESIRAKLLKLEEVVSELKDLHRLGEETFRNSRAQMWSVERGLQLGAEILLDIGTHILSAQYGISPADYKDILEQLGQQGILSKDLRKRLKGLAGFRNILVHDYIRLDPEKVLEAFHQAPEDFSDFTLAIQDWLAGRPAS